ncbi:DUF1549 domain-containing protein [Planctomyces sp. SH-PL62]|uniref:DUF1549 domain-containing protein n=1 Tax=Planctomyces sp. SH-PL62 TaxID=1636152 RepID=UPI00078B6E0F|nr:DUF1549 domain-containing protein [Planctomyces sp. SH-PL62]AMV36126.1 hypothetical protein VT85_01690 [Planctomyces sp. SH-PL62]
MNEGTVDHRRGSGRWATLAAAGWLGLAAVAIAEDPPAPAAEARPGVKAEADKPPDAQAAKEVVQAAVKKKRAKPAPAQPPKRPERKVVAPTMTSADLDALVAARLAGNSPGVKPAPATGDLEFVRRIYLDVTGVVPTPVQVRDFLQDESATRRADLIDELLATPDYARNWSRYWREVVQFRASNANAQQVRYDLLEDWLADQFSRNRPWDEIAVALLTAQGRTDENGAASFAAAHTASPVQLAGEASRVFLGVQIQCAECHDHKTDSWKREQFHELAAFFAGGRVRRVVKPSPGVRAAFAVEQAPRARYAMPDLSDPAKTIPVKPRFFLASSGSGTAERVPDGLSPAQLRELAASYITGQDNPWFARAYINRIWTVLMGEGFYDLIDDIGPEREVHGQEILFPLADQWREGGYDVRWLFRTLLNTQAYQRRARPASSPAGRTQLAAACASRLRSDQIFESLAVALDLPTGSDPAPNGSPRKADGTPLKPVKASAKAKNVKKAAEAAGLAGAAGKGPARGTLRNPFNKLFGVDPSTLPDEVLGTIPQALFLMNGPIVHNRTQARPGTPLGAILARSTGDREALDALYMLVLSRRPNAREVEVCGAYMAKAGDRKEAFEDVYWSLVNSTEFLSRR